MGIANEVAAVKDVRTTNADFIMMQTKEKFTDHYKVESQCIGEGSYGSVRKCQKLGTLEWRAVKIISKTRMSDS